MTVSHPRGRAAPASTIYPATRLTYDSAADFQQTRARFDERVPVLDPSLPAGLVLAGAGWEDVEAMVDGSVGPTGLAAIARIDQGTLWSLSGERIDATLYLVGNPVIARGIAAHEPGAALYAPFRVAVYRDDSGVHIAYDQPSTVFRSLGSSGVDGIAVQLDELIRTVVEESCR